MLITNLHNHTQPLIRYELTDRLIRHPPHHASGNPRAAVEGVAPTTFSIMESLPSTRSSSEP